jgi:hypothetical protein
MRRRSPSIPRRLPSLAFVAATVLAAAVSGCDLMTAVATAKPSRIVATPEPRVTAEPEPSDEFASLRPDQSGATDIVDAANALADLDSYRVTVRARGLVPATPAGGTVTMASTLLQGDHPAASFSMTGVDGFDEGRLGAVVIGDQAWLRSGTARWKKSPGGAADFDAAFTTLSPIDLAAGFDGLSAALADAGADRRNGIRVRHEHASASAQVAVAAGLTAGSVDLWIATSGGYLVGFVVDGTWDVDGTPTRTVLRIEVSHPNDRANVVTPPK